ncbi:aldo/keto reductase [Paenibacillus sp. J5C_2022]|uniref:aldo/keto reductase n=1 Tax=Paenibacillus sp. J5C2022 TaxID=2977129 RepID=UPI0021CF776B|nr:aldo/keto reductase [Paenibacillus sp. J5C2022]MCU6711846.1 aldo/keto reductase [Paenibacillus sp. J5C2022]
MANKKMGMVPSRLTLGTVQLGMPYGIHNRNGVPSEESSFELLREAWEGGVVSFDTASAYGQSEMLLGRFFEGKRPLIMTKIAMQPEPGATPDMIERDMREKIERSLVHLRLSVVPILMLHNTDVMKHYGDAISGSFRTMVREGLVEKAGISISHNTKEEYETMWKYLQDDSYDAIQIPMNMLDHRPLRNGCLDMLSRAGKTVFVRSVFLQGLIHMKAEELPAGLQEARGPLAVLRELSERYTIPLAQMAVSFIRDMPGVNSLIIGAETREQVRENMALIGGPAIPDRMRAEMMELFRDVPEKVITPGHWNRTAFPL